MSLTKRTQTILEVALCDDVAAKEISASVGSGGASGTVLTINCEWRNYDTLAPISTFTATVYKIGQMVSLQFSEFYPALLGAGVRGCIYIDLTQLGATWLPVDEVDWIGSFDNEGTSAGIWVAEIFPFNTTPNIQFMDSLVGTKGFSEAGPWAAGSHIGFNGVNLMWISVS